MPQVIANARLADGRHVDVHVADGRITDVVAHAPAPLARTDPLDRVDLDGWLLLPAMAEPHAHVDKALTAERVPNPSGDLAGAIEAWVAAADAGLFTHDDMVDRIRSALDLLVSNGVTAVRSHINCGAGAGTSTFAPPRKSLVSSTGSSTCSWSLSPTHRSWAPGAK